MNRIFNRTLFLFLSLSLTACATGSGGGPTSVPPPTTGNSDIQQELDRASELNTDSARFSVIQSQNAYFQITGDLLTVPINVSAYERLNSEVLPPMLAASNWLVISNTQNELRQEYERIFNDSAAQLLRGINNNLSLYQGLFEANQTFGINNPAGTFEALTQIFQATEYTERYFTQLGQFAGLLPESQRSLTAILNQQSVVVNGVLKTVDLVEDRAVLLQGYQSLVETLTRSELLPVLTQLAIEVYGSENVALRQPTVTPIQTNPSPTEAVIREAPDQYRVISIESGRLQNTLVTDTRGLSASDYLQQTTVVQVQNPQGS